MTQKTKKFAKRSVSVVIAVMLFAGLVLAFITLRPKSYDVKGTLTDHHLVCDASLQYSCTGTIQISVNDGQTLELQVNPSTVLPKESHESNGHTYISTMLPKKGSLIGLDLATDKNTVTKLYRL